MLRTPALFMLIISGIFPSAALADQNSALATPYTQPVLFCGDKAGWPPYTYEEGKTLKGYDLDVLARIFEKTGQSYKVHMLPWRRCLEMVKDGQMHVALSASGNEERATTYRMSAPYYYMTPSYIYLKSRFPDGLDIPPNQITKHHKVCGLRGYSYHSFGIASEKVETTSRTFSQLFSKTAAGRCDLLLARYEVLLGFALTGTPLLSELWQHTPVPGIEADDFRMLVSRNLDNSESLHQFLNQSIISLDKTGVLDELLEAYLKP